MLAMILLALNGCGLTAGVGAVAAGITKLLAKNHFPGMKDSSWF
jgi:hypothetical protein